MHSLKQNTRSVKSHDVIHYVISSRVGVRIFVNQKKEHIRLVSFTSSKPIDDPINVHGEEAVAFPVDL